MGRRITKKVNGVVVEKYLWQGLTRLLAVFDGSNNLVTRFSYADGRMPVSMTTSGVTYYLFYDQVGSLRAVVDGSGNVVKDVFYDSFGSIINESNPSFAMPFGFAGGLHDRDTGLVRFGARDYDPAIGKWTAKDPIDFAGGAANLYGYVKNNPVNLVDPFGLYWLYQQSTGDMFYVNNKTGVATYVGTGYSGHNVYGYNNHWWQGVPNVGPIPEGRWNIGPQYNSKTLGPGVMNLDPMPGTNTYDRNLFRIHGDNRCSCGDASTGCIILGPAIRNKIANSSDPVLEVIQ